MSRIPRLAQAVAALTVLASVTSGQVITVTTTADVVDFAGGQQVADLPGPDRKVSFREACTAANSTPGPQTIEFAIPAGPPNEWTGGVATLFMDFNVFVLSDDGTTVDFSTQTAFTGDTNPGGNEVGIRTAPITGAPAIYVSGDHCTIRGLDRVSYCGYGVQLAGDGNRVVGCTISGPLYAGVYISGGFGSPPASRNVVGGTLPGEGNVLSSGNDGVRIDAPADENVVIGNVLTAVYHGVAVRGSIYTTFPHGNRIGGPTPGERNVVAGAGKYGEEGFPDGAQVLIEHANGTLVEGNFIGTTVDGTAPDPGQIGPVGVSVVDSTDTVVRGNVISGIVVPGVNHYAGQVFGDGVRVQSINGPTSDTTIEDNRIGTDPSGLLPVPNHFGVRVVPFIASQPITGTVVRGNTVAFNDRDGCVVASGVGGVRLEGNAIHDNGALGIDLLGPGGAGGVTPNDALDADAGGNGLQNFPVLDTATREGAATRVAGTLHSSAAGAFTLAFFASDACDPTGFGEGAVLLGSAAVTTDASGDAPFDLPLPTAAPQGSFVTATATREPSGDTSEFSACVPVGDAGPWTDLGSGLAGLGGVPSLVGSGPLTTGSAGALTLVDAAPNAPAMIFVSAASTPVGFKCGTLVPVPVLVATLLATSGAGTIPVSWASWAPGLSGASLFFQYAVADGTAVCGVSLSNAVRADVP